MRHLDWADCLFSLKIKVNYWLLRTAQALRLKLVLAVAVTTALFGHNKSSPIFPTNILKFKHVSCTDDKETCRGSLYSSSFNWVVYLTTGSPVECILNFNARKNLNAYFSRKRNRNIVRGEQLFATRSANMFAANNVRREHVRREHRRTMSAANTSEQCSRRTLFASVRGEQILANNSSPGIGGVVRRGFAANPREPAHIGRCLPYTAILTTMDT